MRESFNEGRSGWFFLHTECVRHLGQCFCIVDWNGQFFIVGDCAKNCRYLASLVLKELMTTVPIPISWEPKYLHSVSEFTWVVAFFWDNFRNEEKFWATWVSYLQGSLCIMWAVYVWASIPLVLHGVGQKLFLLGQHSNGVVRFQ